MYITLIRSGYLSLKVVVLSVPCEGFLCVLSPLKTSISRHLRSYKPCKNKLTLIVFPNAIYSWRKVTK